jgi:general secretion pathway protein M
MALSPRRGARAPLATLSAELVGRWRAMSGRERRLVLLAAGFVAVALAWLVLLRPALRTEARAPQRIAQLQAQLALARSQADELARLAAQAPVHAQAADLGAAATRWLRAHGAQAQAASLPGSVTLQVQHLPASELAEFARTARQEWAAQVASAKLRLDGGADATSLSGSLELQSRQADSGNGGDTSPGQAP